LLGIHDAIQDSCRCFLPFDYLLFSTIGFFLEDETKRKHAAFVRCDRPQATRFPLTKTITLSNCIASPKENRAMLRMK